MADSQLARQKKRPKNKTDQKNNWIVGQMWLGILSDQPLFYQTCPVGPTLLGKTDMLTLTMKAVPAKNLPAQKVLVKVS